MFIQPMLLQPSEPFNDESYISELKMDGIRLLYSRFNNEIKLYTRHNNEVTRKFPEVLSNDIPEGTILDGELIQTNEDGHPDFEALMSRFHVSNKDKIIIYSKKEPVTFCVFDILYHKGKSVMHLPLLERKSLLEEVLPEDTPRIVKVRHHVGRAVELFNLCKELGLEGVVMKRRNSAYVKKRSHDWKKAVNYQKEAFYILGQRKGEFGLLLGEQTDKGMRSVGMMEFVPPAAKKAIYSKTSELKKEETKEMIYFRPEVMCIAKYRNRTRAGNLRIPSFVEFD